jgi:hypothetical protein
MYYSKSRGVFKDLRALMPLMRHWCKVSRLFSGMQICAYSIRDEGAQTAVDIMVDKGKVSTIYPTANLPAGRHPDSIGEFPHNPVRKSYYTQGGLYFDPHDHHYGNNKFKFAKTPEDGLKDVDVIQEIVQVARAKGVRILPWVMALHDDVLAELNRQYAMTDFLGRPIRGWLCPSNPEVETFLSNMVEDLLSNYDIQGIFLDLVRFPEWGGIEGGFGAALSCFCPRCAARAKSSGLDLEKVSQRVRYIVSSLGDTLNSFLTLRRGHLDLAKFVVDEPEVAEWIRFRQRIVTELVEHIHRTVKNTKPSAELALDIWSPSYSWLLGQNYEKLSEHCDSIKYFTYQKLGGGVDISAVLNKLSKFDQRIPADGLLDLFYRMFGFRGPKDLEELKLKGLSIDFVGDETAKAINEVRRRANVYAGIQIWNVTKDDIRQTMIDAIRAGAEGFVHLGYDWATLENIQAVGEVVDEIN